MSKYNQHARDGNHGSITRTFQALGCTVQDTSQVGGGFPDLVVAVFGTSYLVEVKSDDGKLSPSQVGFCDRWRGAVYMVKTDNDVVNMVQGLAKRRR